MLTLEMNEQEPSFNFESNDNEEILYSEILRDVIIAFMPPATANARYEVVVQYLPDSEEDIELTLTYEPESYLLSIEAEERIPTGFIVDEGCSEPVVIYSKGCMLKIIDGEVIDYSEGLGELNTPSITDEEYLEVHNDENIQHASREVTAKLTNDKVEYFLDLLARV